MHSTKPKFTHKQLIKAVAKRIDYHEYQVEDILHGLALVMQDKLNENQQVQLKGLGAFSLRVSKPRTFKAVLDGGKLHTVQTKRGVSLKPDLYMRNGINREVEGQPRACDQY